MDPIIILLAFVAGFLFRRIGFPPLLGYLLAGFVGNWLDWGSKEGLQPLADFGIILLLFTIGLKLNPKNLAPRYVWGSAVLHMVVAVLLNTAVLYVVGMVYEPLSFDSHAAPWTLAFALSFSSTVLAIKLFDERGEGAAFYATIAIGVLVVQDILAVIYLVAVSGYLPSPWALLLLLLPLAKPLIARVLPMVGHGELLLLAGILFAFDGAALFEAVDLKGGLGALLIGMLVAQSVKSKADEIYVQLSSLKNLLLIGFFLQIGYYGLPELELLVVAAVLTVLIVLRPIIYFALLTRFRLRARTAWLTSLSLFNYSEFGLIVASIAGSAGLIGDEWITTLALAMALSYFIAIPVNRKAHELYRANADKLRAYESSELLPEEHIGSIGGATIAVFGMGSIGRAAFDRLKEEGFDNIVGIEENNNLVQSLIANGWNAVHGDVSDRDFWERTGLVNCEMILVSLSNHAENLLVAKLARDLGYEGEMAITTRYPDHNASIEELGYHPYYRYVGVGRDFAESALEHLR
ncbi:MAG: potassium transporter Kef, partial [Gammaproteobacteria bacterium]